MTEIIKRPNKSKMKTIETMYEYQIEAYADHLESRILILEEENQRLREVLEEYQTDRRCIQCGGMDAHFDECPLKYIG